MPLSRAGPNSLAGLNAPPPVPLINTNEKTVNPMANGAKPVFDWGVDAYKVNPEESEIVLNDMLSLFCTSASSNATVNAIYVRKYVNTNSVVKTFHRLSLLLGLITQALKLLCASLLNMAAIISIATKDAKSWTKIKLKHFLFDSFPVNHSARDTAGLKFAPETLENEKITAMAWKPARSGAKILYKKYGYIFQTESKHLHKYT